MIHLVPFGLIAHLLSEQEFLKGKFYHKKYLF